MIYENLILIGFVMLIVAILLIIVGAAASSKIETKFAFGGFIGPIPFGFANDPRLLWIILIISIVLILFFIWRMFL